MDYRKVINDQIEHLEKIQSQVNMDVASACKIAETILLLCKEIVNTPRT